MYSLPETELVKFNVTSMSELSGTFVIEPLYPGYGITLSNSIRRVLLSSLEGAAITSVKIEGIKHEFSVLPGVKEEIVGLILNLKSLRFKLFRDEPVTLQLQAKGPKVVTAKDFKTNPDAQVITTDNYIATLGPKANLTLEVVIEKGRGYVPVERRGDQQLPLGTIAIDSIFTPVKKVHFEVENTRVGGMTNFDKLTLEITTDGTISPATALSQATTILTEHLQVIHSGAEIVDKKPEVKSKSIIVAKAKKASKRSVRTKQVKK